MPEISERITQADLVSTIAEYQSVPWAILPERLAELQAILEMRVRGEAVTDQRILAAIGSSNSTPGAIKYKSTAILSLHGSIFQRPNIYTRLGLATSTDEFGALIDQFAADDDVSTILIDVNSPGGSTSGVPELASKIHALGQQKKIVAVANTMMASAAYWIGSAATEVVAAPSALVGSIGVLTMHVDQSKLLEEFLGIKVTLISAGKHKVDGNPYEPLSEQARKSIQTLVDDYYDLFVSAVALQRGVSADDVRSGFGQGKVVLAAEAARLGMVDRVETMEQALLRLSAEAGTRAVSRGSGHSVSLLEREVEALNY